MDTSVKWTLMSGKHHDLKVAIDKYVAQLYTFDCALSCLNDMLADIKRKKISLKRCSLEVVMLNILKYVSFTLRKLPRGTRYVDAFSKCVNENFVRESITLYPIMTELVTRFKKAKKLVEKYYINTSLYTPFAEVPSLHKVKATEGDTWGVFESYVDAMEQEPKSRGKQDAGPTPGTEGHKVQVPDLLDSLLSFQ
jgi:hypothetical protein